MVDNELGETQVWFVGVWFVCAREASGMCLQEKERETEERDRGDVCMRMAAHPVDFIPLIL